MDRHAYMLDLLRPGITFEKLIQNFYTKRELTNEDFDEIIKNAYLVMEAAKMAKRFHPNTQ